MTTAIVFICIEVMQGHLASAVSLLQHSVAMLPNSGNQQMPLYEDIISRLQIHARRVSHPPVLIEIERMLTKDKASRQGHFRTRA